jgi:hypothetical protein
MPPLGRSLVDSNAVGLMADWIRALRPAPPLPVPWNHQDIGPVGLKGSAALQGDAFTLAGSGTDIWGIADEFHFVYQRLSGDGELTARVVRVRRSDEWAQAGVMIRESLEPGSRYAHMFASADFGPVFDWRPAVDGKCIGGSSNILWNVPYWVKVARQGTNFAGYYSKNGTDWKLFRRESMPMAEDTYVGLSVTAHNNGAINQAVFDHVEVSVSPATAGRKN